MIFRYVRYGVAPTPSVPSGEVFRPRIPLRVFGPNNSVQLFGLLDTGADQVFLPKLLAKILAIQLDDDLFEAAEGAGGHELKVWPARVDIEIVGDGRDYRWNAHVGFIDSDDTAAALLGHVGFLEHFEATFDYDEKSVELIPKSSIG